MAGNCSSVSVGVVVCVRAPVSAVQPEAKPVRAKGLRSTEADICRTLAMARIGDNWLSRLPISASSSVGTT